MLLEADVLVIDERSVVLTDDFSIYDEDNNKIGEITVDGAALKRMVMGNRQFTVRDGKAVSFLIDDKLDIGLDHFKVTTPDGDPIATIIKHLSLLMLKLSIEMHDGTELTVHEHWGLKYQVSDSEGDVAVIDWGWKNTKAALLDHDQYRLTFTRDVPPAVRQAVIAAAISIDRISAKFDDKVDDDD